MRKKRAFDFFFFLSRSSLLRHHHRRRHGPVPRDVQGNQGVSRSRHSSLLPRFPYPISTRKREEKNNNGKNAGNNYIVVLEREESSPSKYDWQPRLNRSLGCDGLIASRVRIESREPIVVRSFHFRLPLERILSRSRTARRIFASSQIQPLSERTLYFASFRILKSRRIVPDSRSRETGCGKPCLIFFFFFLYIILLSSLRQSVIFAFPKDA